MLGDDEPTFRIVKNVLGTDRLFIGNEEIKGVEEFRCETIYVAGQVTTTVTIKLTGAKVSTEREWSDDGRRVSAAPCFW